MPGKSGFSVGVSIGDRNPSNRVVIGRADRLLVEGTSSAEKGLTMNNLDSFNVNSSRLALRWAATVFLAWSTTSRKRESLG